MARLYRVRWFMGIPKKRANVANYYLKKPFKTAKRDSTGQNKERGKNCI